MNWDKFGFFGAVITLALMVGLSLDAHINGENSVIGIALTLSPEEPATDALSADEDDNFEIVYVEEKSEYDGGDVAFVDYSVDRRFGDCVVVWVESRSLFSHCDDIEAGWQTLYQRKVPDGTDYWAISTHWNETFAPYNWSS